MLDRLASRDANKEPNLGLGHSKVKSFPLPPLIEFLIGSNTGELANISHFNKMGLPLWTPTPENSSNQQSASYSFRSTSTSSKHRISVSFDPVARVYIHDSSIIDNGYSISIPYYNGQSNTTPQGIRLHMQGQPRRAPEFLSSAQTLHNDRLALE